jgi:hypothetical protein
MEQDIIPLRQARDEAKGRLRDIQDEIRLIEFNASNPDYALMGFGPQTQAAFEFFFFGRFIPYLLGGSDFLREESFAFLDFICERSGYRTDKRDLPSDAEHYRKHWQEIYDRANPPAPVSRDVRDITQSEILGELTRVRVREEYARQDAAAAADWRGDRETEIRRRVQVTPDPAKDYQPLRNIRT